MRKFRLSANENIDVYDDKETSQDGNYTILTTYFYDKTQQKDISKNVWIHNESTHEMLNLGTYELQESINE